MPKILSSKAHKQHALAAIKQTKSHVIGHCSVNFSHLDKSLRFFTQPSLFIAV